MSRSSSGNSVNSSSDYAVPRCQSFAPTDNTPPSSEDSGSSCSGSMQRNSHKKGPLRGIHGLTMSKHSSQDSIDQHRNSMDAVAQYATLRRSTSRKHSSQSLDFNHCNGAAYPSSPMSKCSNTSTSPGLGSLPSPFAGFLSPYTQIQSGEVKNQLADRHRSSSVPSSPVTKTAPSPGKSSKKPPAPPKRTLSMKRNTEPIEVELDEESHEFPPPPPPIAFDLQAMKAHQPKSKSKQDFSLSLESRQSPSRGLKLQDVSESNLAARRRKEPSPALENTNTNNSTPSDTTPTKDTQNVTDETPRNSAELEVPFANDNAGTIRSKTVQSKVSALNVDYNDDEETSEDNESDFDYDTVKRKPGKLNTRLHSQ